MGVADTMERMNPDREQQDDTRCRRCERVINEAGSFHLWDGNTYCRTCVERAGLELAAYAREHSSLRDNPVFPAWRVVAKVLLIGWLFITVLFGSIGVLEGFRQQSVEAALVGIGIFQALFVPVACLFGTVIYAAVSTADWTIEISDGNVCLPRAGRQISLSSCEWFVGKTTDATSPPFVPRVAAVLLAMRPEGVMQEAVVVASVNPEMLPVWIQFLTLAGLRRRTLWERRSRARRATFVAGGFAAVMVAVAATGWIGVWCARLLNILKLPKEVSDAVMFAFVVPGCIWTAFGVLLLWPWLALPRVPSRRSHEEQRRIRRQYLFPMVSSFFSVVYLLRGEVIGFVVYFVLWLAFTALFGLIVGHFLATREYATTEESLAERRN